MKLFSKLIGATALLAAMAISAQAVPITGQINIGPALGTTAQINTAANTVSFSNVNPAVVNNASVTFVSGSFASVTDAAARYFNFTYDPFAPLTVWQLAGSVAGAFQLTSVTIIEETSNFLSLRGTGIATLAGYDATPGAWTFSADSTTGVNFNFSSTTTAVPDSGATAAMLGAALVGLALMRRRRSAA